jgi:hypothetical protein
MDAVVAAYDRAAAHARRAGFTNQVLVGWCDFGRFYGTSPFADFMTTAAGGKLGKRERVTVGGLPGFRWRASHLRMQEGGRVDARLTHLFKGLKGYLVTCLYTPKGAVEVKRACDQALGSFRLTSGG